LLMLSTILMIAAIIFLPRLMLLACNKFSPLRSAGPVFLCYLIGLLLSFAFKRLGADLSLASYISFVMVLLAIPLVLFSANLPSLKKLAGPMLVSFSFDAVAVILVAAAGYFIFRSSVPEAATVSGMLTGTYTGGTPNMIAIGVAVGASESLIMLTQTSDMIAGGIYFFLLLSVLPGVLKKMLPRYKPTGAVGEATGLTQEYDPDKARFGWKTIRSRLALVGLSLLCVFVAAAIAAVLPSRLGNDGIAGIGGRLNEYIAVIMLAVTTFGIALSFVKKVRRAQGSYSAGQYFILMFSVAMGLCFDLSALKGAAMILLMLLFVQFGTVALHILFSKICHIDRDTMLITSTAGVFGPAFIMPVAKALKNDEIILPGIICGILGYAIGNYLGIGLTWVLRLFA